MRLENKVAMITGGGSVIDRATAVLFAREGPVSSSRTSGSEMPSIPPKR